MKGIPHWCSFTIASP